MLAIVISRNAGDGCQLLYFSEMLATNVRNCKFQKCWRWMLAIRMFTNAGDECYQLDLEMLATNSSNYDFQKHWRYMLAIIVFGNAGDKC